MSGSCANHLENDVSPTYRRALAIVLMINAVMFVAEMSAGIWSGSQALKSDALDFGGDAATYGVSLLVLGAGARVRASASLAKSLMLLVMALGVLGSTLSRLRAGVPPEAMTMGVVGLIALAANVASVLILMRWRGGDSNMRSVWLCSRNDAIGNLAVIGAGLLVATTGSAWPDLAVALLMASLFLSTATSVARQALRELRSAGDGAEQRAGSAS